MELITTTIVSRTWFQELYEKRFCPYNSIRIKFELPLTRMCVTKAKPQCPGDSVIFLRNLKNSINFSSLNCLTWSYLFYRIEPYLFQVLFDLENLTRKRKDAFWDAGQSGSGYWWPARRTSGSRASSRSRPAPTSRIVEQHLRFSLNSILMVRLISCKNM